MRRNTKQAATRRWQCAIGTRTIVSGNTPHCTWLTETEQNVVLADDMLPSSREFFLSAGLSADEDRNRTLRNDAVRLTAEQKSFQTLVSM